jgi:hypothetical protein
VVGLVNVVPSDAVTDLPSWRVLVLAEPTGQWDVHLITNDESDAREQAGHLRHKGMKTRVQYRRDRPDEWEDVDFVEGPSS